jgi:hypothetical protein
LPTPTYTALANITLGSSASSVTFSSIPATYRDLVYVISGQLVSASPTNTLLRFNGDSGNNYNRVFAFANSGGISSGADSLVAQANPWFATNEQGNAIGTIMDYSATDKHKTMLSRYNGITAGLIMSATRWANTSAITSMAFSNTNNFAAGTTFALYGIAS